MSEVIDARGLSCPQPVVLTKKVLDVGDEVAILVDNDTARENVKRYAEGAGCAVTVIDEGQGVYRIEAKRAAAAGKTGGGPDPSGCETAALKGPSVVVLAASTMGRGDDDLGALLMKAFIHTTLDLEEKPDIVILYNSGVKLAVTDSDVLDDLRAIEAKGTSVLVCGTCLNYFDLGGRIGVGTVSNMYDIATVLSTARRIVKP